MPQENMHCSRHSGTNDLPTRTAKKKNTLLKSYAVDALISGHPWDTKEVPITRAGHLQE